MDKYIIGNNDVSYFLGYLFPETTVILHQTLEELDYNCGPKIIQPSLISIIRQEFDTLEIQEFERFYIDRGKCTSILPKNFENLYALYTRGKTLVEESYNTTYSKYEKYISINNLGPEESYDLFIEKIKGIIYKRVIDKPIKELDLSGKIIFDDDFIEYDKIISTMNIIDLVSLETSGKLRKSIIENYKLDGFNLPYNDKFIYVCSLDSSEDKTLSNLYKQVLATGKPYYRKTYIDNKIIYESMRNIYEKNIEENKILKYVESTQISDNLSMNKLLGIDLVGKFSQWNENTTLETIYNKANQLQEFYISSENNHKKVL